MNLVIGEKISEELKSYIQVAWRDPKFKKELEESTDYKYTWIASVINGRKPLNEDNVKIVLTATRLAIRRYTDNAILFKNYAKELKKLKVINKTKKTA